MCHAILKTAAIETNAATPTAIGFLHAVNLRVRQIQDASVENTSASLAVSEIVSLCSEVPSDATSRSNWVALFLSDSRLASCLASIAISAAMSYPSFASFHSG